MKKVEYWVPIIFSKLKTEVLKRKLKGVNHFFPTVNFEAPEFKRDCSSSSNDERVRRSRTATTIDYTGKI